MSYQVDDNAYPGQTVVLVQASWGGVTVHGSGFLVGRNDVITAGHMIYNQALGGWADQVTVYPSYNPWELSHPSYGVVYMNGYTNFDPDGDGALYTGDGRLFSQGGAEIDIALLSLADPIGDLYGYLGIDWNHRGGWVDVLGYPANRGYSLTYDSGYASRSYIDDVYILGYSLDINPGNSGGPLLYESGGQWFAIGAISTARAAVELGGHRSWLTTAMVENNRYLIEIEESEPAADGSVAVYRFYNTKAGGHFFTANSQERSTVLGYSHFGYEGVDFRAHETAQEDTVPIHRFYNTVAGGHFFTANEDEMRSVLANLPQFQYEGVGFHAYASSGEGTPVYRFYNTEAGGHFFTANAEERDVVINTMGATMTFEGVGFNAMEA